MKEFWLTVWKGFVIISIFVGLTLAAGLILAILGAFLYLLATVLQALLGVTGTVILMAALAFVVACYEIGKR